MGKRHAAELLRPVLICGTLGNVELLEATPSHTQVLPRRRGSKRTTSTELHARFLGGKFLNHTPMLSYLILLQGRN